MNQAVSVLIMSAVLLGLSGFCYAIAKENATMHAIPQFFRGLAFALLVLALAFAVSLLL